MKKDLTEIVFILDRSGSMSGLEADTIGGFNSMIMKQRHERGEALVTTVLFDDRAEVIHDRVPIEGVAPITRNDYYVRGCTDLLDAVGTAIERIGTIHKYARREDVPERTLFIITTDGMENASRQYGYNDVKRMIERQKRRFGWEFIFLGANIDAGAVGERMGISRDHSAEYYNDSQGAALNYEVMSEAISAVRCCKAPLSANWKNRIDEDMKNRSEKKHRRGRRV